MKFHEGIKTFANDYFKKHNSQIGTISDLLLDLINDTKDFTITVKEIYDKYGEKLNYQQGYKNIGSDIIAVNKKMEIRILSFQDSDSANLDLLNELSQKKIVTLDQDGQLIGIHKNPYTRDQERKVYSFELLGNIVKNRKSKEDRIEYITENTELLLRFKERCSKGNKIESFSEQSELMKYLRAHINILIQKEIAYTVPEANPKGCLVILKDENTLGIEDKVYRVSEFKKDDNLGMIIKINIEIFVQSKELYFFRFKDIKLYLEGIKFNNKVIIK